LNSKLFLKQSFDVRYSADGIKTLVDGVRGTNNFRDGQWLGFEEVDLDATIDFGMEKEISKITLGCLQNSTSWIFLPEYVEFQISDNTNNFKTIGSIKNDIPQNTTEVLRHDFCLNFERIKVRSIKVKAKNIRKCPAWHPGAGGKAWLFVDEIIAE
jgi:hexosaminidase